MKLMTYNIMEGGVRNGNDINPSRLEKVLGVIQEQDAQVLGLQETLLTEGDDNELVSALRRTGRYPYDVVFSKEGRPLFRENTTGTALFSTQAPLSTFMGEGVKAVEMTFPRSPSRPSDSLSVCSVYLSHVSEATRLPQMKEVLQELRREKYGLLMGDFNALSPEDGILASAVDSFSPRMKEKYCRDGKLCYDTIEAVLEAGYIDVGLRYHPPQDITGKTDLSGPTTGGGHTQGIRMDFIFAKPEVLPSVKEFVMVKEGLARIASDHFPWYVVLDDIFNT